MVQSLAGSSGPLLLLVFALRNVTDFLLQVSDATIDFLQIEQRLNDTHCGTSFRIQLIKITYELDSLPTLP